jgi:predicted TPR repeat methyltransferase
LVREQVLIAALDVHDLAEAKTQAGALTTKFPSSLRVRRLLGMTLEAQEKWDKAAQVYTDILERDADDSVRSLPA